MKFCIFLQRKEYDILYPCPAQCTSYQGSDCVIFDTLSAIDCNFGREARRSTRIIGA
jgi:hypothetical protein